MKKRYFVILNCFSGPIPIYEDGLRIRLFKTSAEATAAGQAKRFGTSLDFTVYSWPFETPVCFQPPAALSPLVMPCELAPDGQC